MVNILFCGNIGVFDGMLTTALSLVKRTESKEPFCFHLFTMDVSHLKDNYVPITAKQVAFFERTVKSYNPENQVKLFDVTDLYMQHFSGCPNEGAYCSPYTLIRLFADLIDGIPDKLLYLDIDLLFQRDVHLLYDIDINGYEYAAARDHYGKYILNPNYINAGVILFNMKECRKTGLFEKARAWIKRKKLTFADQSAIIRSTTRKKMLPQRFNDQKFLHPHTVVRHFSKRLFYLPYPHTDNIKQWHVDRVHKVFGYHQFDDILNEYLSLKEKFDKE
ncbi:MAG: lipopolysaccharide biosynthesis protein [Spirochaetales bacterium]|nr:lipopolysaccharide biosynthesis protein [Spirochaetales bacterium]MBR0519813.1 lipopolysaccharide biosynthesis protein [Spirochaetales bacterium]